MSKSRQNTVGKADATRRTQKDKGSTYTKRPDIIGDRCNTFGWGKRKDEEVTKEGKQKKCKVRQDT